MAEEHKTRKCGSVWLGYGAKLDLMTMSWLSIRRPDCEFFRPPLEPTTAQVNFRSVGGVCDERLDASISPFAKSRQSRF